MAKCNKPMSTSMDWDGWHRSWLLEDVSSLDFKGHSSYTTDPHVIILCSNCIFHPNICATRLLMECLTLNCTVPVWSSVDTLGASVGIAFQRLSLVLVNSGTITSSTKINWIYRSLISKTSSRSDFTVRVNEKSTTAGNRVVCSTSLFFAIMEV